MTESDLGWPTPTNDIRPIVTKPLGMVVPWSRNQWIQSPYITHAFDYKANIYSKLMAITTACTGVSCHTMQIILSDFTCMSFYKFHLVNMFNTTFFYQNARVHLQ
jgi:hypothetical protein